MKRIGSGGAAIRRTTRVWSDERFNRRPLRSSRLRGARSAHALHVRPARLGPGIALVQASLLDGVGEGEGAGTRA